MPRNSFSDALVVRCDNHSRNQPCTRPLSERACIIIGNLLRGEGFTRNLVEEYRAWMMATAFFLHGFQTSLKLRAMSTFPLYWVVGKGGT